jgi:hypothetical protein
VDGWHSPIQDTLDLHVHANAADGATLGSATLSFAGRQVTSSLCPTAEPCTATAADGAELAFPTKFADGTKIPDGTYPLTVTVTDADGTSATVLSAATEIWNDRPTGSNTATLTIGSGVPAPQPGSPNGGNGGSGGVAGATASSCSRPKLSVMLDQKPLRIRHGVPVLQRGQRYRFRGRLTCVVDHKRVSAPKRTRIDRLDKVGRRTVSKGGALVRGGGRITFIVPALSSRTLIFRFIGGGHRLDVKIKIKVAGR